MMGRCLAGGVAWGAVMVLLTAAGSVDWKAPSRRTADQAIKPGVASRATEQPRKGRAMAVEQIVKRVRQTDRSLLKSPEQIPAEAGVPLLGMLSEADEEVRELALLYLHYAGGAPAREGVIRSLHDEADAVRSVACRFLSDHEDPSDLPALLGEVTNNADAYVREHVALAIGRIGNTEAAQRLNKQLEQEADPHAQRAMQLALARLGDEPMRQAYLARLGDADPTVRAKALDDFLYVRDKKMLPHILPLLDDLRDAKNVAPAGHQYYIRVCDVAVQVLDEVLGHPFKFDVQFTKRYDVTEIADAKDVLAKKIR